MIGSSPILSSQVYGGALVLSWFIKQDPTTAWFQFVAAVLLGLADATL